MKITKVFFDITKEHSKSDIPELESFFLRINNCYVKKGLYFTPVFSENNQDIESKKQTLAESCIAFFLIDNDTNVKKQELFKAALESYSKSGKPRIVVYVKANSREKKHSKIPDSGYFHNTYNHIDTLKLGILMQIKQLELAGLDIRLEDGKAWQGNDVLMSLSNAESFAGYENLQKLKQKSAELENSYYAAKTRYTENTDDPEAYEAYFEASRQRSIAMQEIQDIETKLYHMIDGMYEQTTKGRLSRRQAECYKLIERGLLHEARDVLDFYAIVEESRHDEQSEEQLTRRAEVHLKELMQLISVNAVLLDWEGVDVCFKEAVHIEEKFNLPRKAALNPVEYDYMEYLIDQHRNDDAIAVADKLLKYYNSLDARSAGNEISLLYNYLGRIYTSTNRVDDAEEMLKASLAVRANRTDGDPNVILKDIAVIHNNLGNLYVDQNRFEEAEKSLASMMEICEKLVQDDRETYSKYLAFAYLNLGDLYCCMERYDESISLTVSSRDIFSELVTSKPDLNEELSLCYENHGIALAKSKRYLEATGQFAVALRMQQGFADMNPGIYEPRVAECANEFGRAYFDAGSYPEAEEKLDLSRKIYNRLVIRDPEAYEPEMAKCCYNLGELYRQTGRLQESKDALATAMRLFNKFVESNPAFAEKARQAQKLLSDLSKPSRLADGEFPQLTPEEKEVALLLTDGLSQRDIVRRLKISAVEVARRVSSVRDKVSGGAGADPVIDAVTHEFGLTRRESEMLRYLHDGVGVDVITVELFLSPETVKIHIRNLLKKLSIENRHEVAAWLEGYANNSAG